MRFVVVFSPPPPKIAADAVPACVRLVRFSTCVPPVLAVAWLMFRRPEVSATAPMVSEYGVAAATVFVTVMLPPFEVIGAAFEMRSSAPSARVVLVSVMLPLLSVMPVVFTSA